jgi:hypothetical protein
MRSQEEIDNQLNLAQEAEMNGTTAWPGMSYEQGVAAALMWATGQSNDLPMVDS